MKKEETTTTNIIPNRARGERGTGSTITIDLTENPELLAKIKAAAKADDREPSKWVRRQIILLGEGFFLGGVKAPETESGFTENLNSKPKRESGYLTEE